MIQQPAQITGCLAQVGQAADAKQMLILGVRASMPAELSHGFELLSETVRALAAQPGANC